MDRNRLGELVRHDPELLAQARRSMQGVLARSATDMEFRRELIASPRQALSRHFGHPVPESFNVVFIENRAAATIVLPDPVDGCELGDSELEAVNGGAERISLIAAGMILGAAGHAPHSSAPD